MCILPFFYVLLQVLFHIMPPLFYPHLCEQPQIHFISFISAKLIFFGTHPIRKDIFSQIFNEEVCCRSQKDRWCLKLPIGISWLFSSPFFSQIRTHILETPTLPHSSSPPFPHHSIYHFPLRKLIHQL